MPQVCHANATPACVLVVAAAPPTPPPHPLHDWRPERFGSIEDARIFCQEFFPWYNRAHRHSGIGLMTPEVVHYGKGELATIERDFVLTAAFRMHPERFVRGTPRAPRVPEAVWINKPKPSSSDSDTSRTPENSTDQGVSGYGPGRDRRSWGILEGVFSEPTLHGTQNEPKFVAQVSQSR